MKKRIVAIIQARMNSTRLPGKVLADIDGKPMLYRMISRVRQAQTLDVVAVATSKGHADDDLEHFCLKAGIPCFRGSEDDVLDRYYEAAKHFRVGIVVRLTADCPLIDPLVIDKIMRVFKEGDFDYVSNTIQCTYPDGLDTEVFSWPTLERAWREAHLKSEREHVTSYIYKHPELFHLGNVNNDADLSALRWTVDEPEDLEFVRAVYAHFGASHFGMGEVLDLLRRRPELGGINAGFTRNEGYQKSLLEDGMFNSDKEQK